VEFYYNSKTGPVVDSKKNMLVLREEVPIFAANKNAHSIFIIVWSISCIIYRTRWMWCGFKSALECVFRSFWFLNQRRCDVRRGLSSRYHGYSNCIIIICVHHVRHIWHAWYVRTWLSILVLNHVTKMFQFTKQQYCIRLWTEQSLYVCEQNSLYMSVNRTVFICLWTEQSLNVCEQNSLYMSVNRTYYFIILSSSSLFCTQYIQYKHNSVL
jgi:hypothetical protein